MRPWLSVALSLVSVLLWLPSAAAQQDYGYGAEDRRLADYEHDLACRLEKPLAAGLDVRSALEGYFRATNDQLPLSAQAREELFFKAFASLEDLAPLPRAKWDPVPDDVALELLETLRLPDELWPQMGIDKVTGVTCRIARFSVDDLEQYGVVLRPTAPGKYPLIVYVHGAAFGVPSSFLPWLCRLAAEGYVIAAPAFRGEDLFTYPDLVGVEKRYRSEGRIENLLGEPRDVLAMAAGARKLPEVAPGKFAILGHSFGAGAGLLAAARSDQVSCVVSYDAWLVNPFRFYWERLRGGSAAYWESWDEYVRAHDVPAQLSGLMARSIVHHADRVQAPVLLFIGGAYNGSGYHDCHEELVAALKKHDKTVRYEIMPGGGHNFVLYHDSRPARDAYRLQMQWLRKYHPPVKPEPAAKGEAPAEPRP